MYQSTMAQDRKSRLAALAAKAGRNLPATDTPTGDDAASSESKPSITFRNYVPKDANLSTSTPANDEGQSSQQQLSTKRLKPNTDNELPKSALERALAKTSHESRQAAGQSAGGWSSVTPVESKKINWDLKRDIAHKMEKLEKRTQKALVDLLRERLEREAAEGGDDDDSDLDWVDTCTSTFIQY